VHHHDAETRVYPHFEKKNGVNSPVKRKLQFTLIVLPTRLVHAAKAKATHFLPGTETGLRVLEREL
jgi:hypothetical protein